MNRMYLALAILALYGAALAPQETRAEEDGKAELSPTQLVQQNRRLAETAQRESAADAADALRDATKLDLDIRVIGHNSVLIAGDFQAVL